MTTHPCRTRFGRGLALLVLAALCSTLAPATRADDASDGKTRRELEEERAKYAVDARTSRRLAKAREALASDHADEARQQLDRLRLDRSSPAGRAQANRLYGYLAYGKQHNAEAIAYLQKALAEDGLAPADRADVLFQLAQIQGAERRWQDVLATLEQWFAIVERPNSVGWFLQAVAYYQLEDLDSALLPATKAVQIATKPQSAWLQLLLAIHLSKKDYSAAAPVLTRLIELYPSIGKGYWVQLSALYGALEDQERALAVMEMAYRKGLLTEDGDLRRLAQLMLYQQIPERAAQIMTEEFGAGRIRTDVESLELLSSAWILAREPARAEEPLARAAELAPKGDLYARLAQIQLVQEEYARAANSLRKALDKGGLADRGSVELLLGITCFNERKLGEARSWFARAQGSARTRKAAESWIEHVDRELERDDT